MATLAKICVAFTAIVIAIANGSPVEEKSSRSLCGSNDDPIACLKFKAMQFFEHLFQRDSYKLSDVVEINRNSYQSNEIASRSFENKIEDYVKGHDVTFTLPIVGSKVTLDARNFDQDEVDLKLSFRSSDAQARKSKLKKIFIPILVFVLLKAMTLIPLALGVLGLKAWNALQLSFFSFIVSVALAVFQLCKKIATDNGPPQISAHGAWDASAAYSSHYASRSLDDSERGAGQDLAYSAHSK